MWFFSALENLSTEGGGKNGISKSVCLMKESMFVPSLERNEKQSIAMVKGFFCTAAKVIECINSGRVQTLKESNSAVSSQ